MNEHPRIKTDPSFFSGVILETSGIARHAVLIRENADKLAGLVSLSVDQQSVALLKAAVELNETVGREIQSDLDRLRGLISHLDRQLAAFQSRRPRA